MSGVVEALGTHHRGLGAVHSYVNVELIESWGFRPDPANLGRSTCSHGPLRLLQGRDLLTSLARTNPFKRRIKHWKTSNRGVEPE